MSYNAITVSAAAAIARKGVTVTHSRVTGGTKSGATGQTTGETTETQSVNAVVLPAAGGRKDSDNRINEGIEQNTAYMLMAGKKADGSALSFAPESGHQIVAGSITWYVTGSTPLAPDAGSAIIHKVAVRR